MVVGADADVTEEIPLNPLTQPYYEYFGPEHRLNLHTTREVWSNPRTLGKLAVAYPDTCNIQLGALTPLNRAPLRTCERAWVAATEYYDQTPHEHCSVARVHILTQAMVDENVRADLERIRMTVIEQLRQLESAPGIHQCHNATAIRSGLRESTARHAAHHALSPVCSCMQAPCVRARGPNACSTSAI